MKNSLNYILILCVAAMLFVGCKGKHKPMHLPQKTMQKVLIDMAIAEGYSTMNKDSLHAMGAKNYDSLAVYYKDILGHYKITQEEFDESLTWYKDNPDELDSAYSNMLPVIVKWQAKYPVK